MKLIGIPFWCSDCELWSKIWLCRFFTIWSFISTPLLAIVGTWEGGNLEEKQLKMIQCFVFFFSTGKPYL
jgi:hypothetical protein